MAAKDLLGDAWEKFELALDRILVQASDDDLRGLLTEIPDQVARGAAEHVRMRAHFEIAFRRGRPRSTPVTLPNNVIYLPARR